MTAIDHTNATAHRLYPSITLLVRLDESGEWRRRLEALRRQADARLRSEFGTDTDHQLLARLDETVSTASPPAGARSLAVFVNGRTVSTAGLDCDVRERTVIDDTFATRDLLADDLRKPRYWVLALTLEDPKLFHGHGQRLHVVPLDLRDTVEHPSDRGSKRGRDKSDVTDARRLRRFRALDQALADALAGSDDPVVVVGTEPTISRFLDTTRHVTQIEGVVRRSPDHHLGRLATSVAPALADITTERRHAALELLDRAIGAGTAASGIEPVWRASRRDPGTLLVEAGYEQPVKVLVGGAIAPTSDATAPDVIDDGVDEIIEAVLARHGRAELVPDGVLADHQRIAFVPIRRRR